MSDGIEKYRRRVKQIRSTVVVLATCCLLTAMTPNVAAARTMAFGGHQPQDGIATTRSPLRQGQQYQSAGLSHRILRSSSASNRHEPQSPAHHPSSPASSSSSAPLTMTDVEQYVDDQIERLETRFTQKLEEQSRKLNQTIAIQYIEKVLDYISEELQNSQEMISAAGRNGDSSDQNDSTGMTTEELNHEVDRQRGELARVKETLSELQSAVSRLADVVNGPLTAPPAMAAPSVATVSPDISGNLSSSSVVIYPIDCQDAYDRGILLHADGFQYTLIQPRSVQEPFRVCCYVNNSVSWTVIQRRFNGSVDFYRNWDQYKRGFGHPDSEFWFGNELIHRLTNQGNYRLRVEMATWDDNPHWAEYQYFRLAPESDRYRLHVSGFVPESDAGDSLTSVWDNDHNGQPFSTYDSDNDARFYDNCAQHYRGAWWFRSCFQSHLNGVYYHRGSHSNFFVRNGIQWNTIHPHSSLRYVAMMVHRNSSDDGISPGNGIHSNDV